MIDVAGVEKAAGGKTPGGLVAYGVLGHNRLLG